MEKVQTSENPEDMPNTPEVTQTTSISKSQKDGNHGDITKTHHDRRTNTTPNGKLQDVGGSSDEINSKNGARPGGNNTNNNSSQSINGQKEHNTPTKTNNKDGKVSDKNSATVTVLVADKEEGLNDPMDSVVHQEKLGNCFKVSMLVSSRLLYSIHLLLTIWRVTVLFGDMYWIATAGLVAFLIDIVFVMVIRKGKEWTWFQPVVLIYLVLELPCIWLMELHKVSTVQVQNNQSAILGSLFESTGVDYLADLVTIDISNESWALILEQSMLVFIIIARWMMPKGDLTRDQLSALLLTYIGIASDVVDFFSVLAEDQDLLLDLAFVMTILSTWTWSMFQFIFITNMTNSESDDEDHLVKLISGQNRDEEFANSDEGEDDATRSRCHHCTHRIRVIVESEIWSILVSMCMQDGPFVVVRLVCVFYWHIKTYTNYFFTAKNCLVLLLQVYRLVAVYHQHQHFRRTQSDSKKRTAAKIFSFFHSSPNGTPDQGTALRRRIHSSSVSPMSSDLEHLQMRQETEEKIGSENSLHLT